MSWLSEGKNITKRILNENPNTRLKSALLGDDKRIKSFAIGTPEEPMDWEALDTVNHGKTKDEIEKEDKRIRREKQERAAENNKRREEFETWLKDGHFKYQEFEGSKMGFVKVNGVYKNSDVKEHSYFIINPSLADAIHLFKLFGQQSFIYAKRDDENNTMTYQLWLRETPDSSFHNVEERTDVNSNAGVKEFFSTIHNFKFNIPFEYFNESIKELREFLDNCSQNEDFYERLDKQVNNKISRGYDAWLNRGFMYETVEHRKERLERIKKSQK